MSIFKEQISEDIEHIQQDYQENNPYLQKEEYAFNYWVLTKLFNIDSEIVDENVTEYNDDGIDCFVFYEDSKELYIIQNKFYSENTQLKRNYVIDDFLVRPLNSLKNNNYKRSEKLQQIFNKIKNDSDYRIYLHMYVTNDFKDQTIIDTFYKYQNNDNNILCYVEAKIFYLSDIVEMYFEDRKLDVKNFKCEFYTINDATFLNINKENYNLPNLIEAKYILTPVSQIYKIIKKAKKDNYQLFAENIREYLGNKGINANIAHTLRNAKDRSNFFYYNNGITVICDDVKKRTNTHYLYNRVFDTYNPQIVNGCQTVNTIFEVLQQENENEIDEIYKDTYVMVKLLKLNASDDSETELYKNIVKYNNSQNKIDEKLFVANTSLFNNLQKELKSRGFLLAVKQSDKFQFKNNEKFNDYRPYLKKYESLFGINFSKIDDLIIPIENFLQVILAFEKGGYQAYTKKSMVLKIDSNINATVVNFIKNSSYTIDDILNIYLLYLKAEKEKKLSNDKKTPIPYYLIGFLGLKFNSKPIDIARSGISYIFSNEQILSHIYFYYKSLEFNEVI